MCTAPLPVHHWTPDGRKVLDFVPCGKCHECISKAQNEFAALACLEAKRRKSMWFFTFTYSNATCPIAKTSLDEFGLRSGVEFVSDCFAEREPVLRLLGLNMDGSHSLHPASLDGVDYCPSLCRKDWRLFIKRTRLAYAREFGSISSFVYAGFGEYGDETYRPHGHFLFYDLTEHEAAYFERCWRERFGFCTRDFIPILNKDGSPARVKVSKYVAKYLHKPKDDFQPLLDGLCEAPRRVSSRGFGVGVVEDQLRDFYLANDLKNQSKEVRLKEIFERKKRLVIDGSKFPLPRRISDKFFREPSFESKYDFVNESTGEVTQRTFRKTRRTALSLQVSDFARDRYLQDFESKLRAYFEMFPESPDYLAVLALLQNEKLSLEDRVKSARKIYLQHLAKEKYG